jgi:hypothetical protein
MRRPRTLASEAFGSLSRAEETPDVTISTVRLLQLLAAPEYGQMT